MNVMKKAWEIAREGAATFGGNVKEYFARALRMAWAIAKKGVSTMQVHTWVNAKGMTFELHAEHITKETRTTDWNDVIETAVNIVRIEKFLVDGKSVQQGSYIDRTVVNGVTALDLGNVVFNGKKQRMVVALPTDVNNAVWGQYDAIKQAQKVAVTTNKKASRNVGSKCGSYCWGDCTAN